MAVAAPIMGALAGNTMRAAMSSYGSKYLPYGVDAAKYLATKGLGHAVGGALASAAGTVLPAIGDGLESVPGKVEDIAKDVGSGIVSAAKKVGSALQKVFHFEEGGRVRRAPTTPPPVYRKGGSVKPFNSKPRRLEDGGRVTRKRGMTSSQLRKDSVRALLQPGEIVIPVTHFQKGKKPIPLAALTAKALKRSGIKLPGM